MSDIVATLRKARELLTPEGAWTRDELARDSSGDPVEPTSPDAVCWCASGAIGRVLGFPEYGTPRDRTWIKTVEALLPNKQHVLEWNDARNRTQTEVLAAFDAAIARAEAA